MDVDAGSVDRVGAEAAEDADRGQHATSASADAPRASFIRDAIGVCARSVGLEVGHAGEPTLSLETSVVLQNSVPEHRDRITGGVVLERARVGITGAVGLALTPSVASDRSVSRRIAGSRRRAVDLGVEPTPDDEPPSSIWRAHGGQHPHGRRLESPPPSRRLVTLGEAASRPVVDRAPTSTNGASWFS